MEAGGAKKADAGSSLLGGIDLNLVVLFVFALVIPFALGTADRIFGDGDVSWHLAAGQWMISHGTVPHTDPFSFSAAGRPWVAHEWLSEVVMGAAYNLAGWGGIAALVSASLFALMLVLWLEISRWLKPVVVAALLIAITVTMVPFLLARPMVLTWPLLAFWTVQLMHARERRKAPSLWLVAVMLLWVNLHASFALGLMLIAPFALEALIEEPDKKRVIVGWSTFGVLCGLACLANPNTYTTLLMPIGAFTDKNITLIQEFRPTDMSFTPGFEYALLLVLAICLGRGAKIAPVRLLIILGMLHLAFQHMRHQVLFIIIAGLLIAKPVGATEEEEQKPADVAARMRFLRIAAATFVLLVGVTLVRPLSPPDSHVNPNAALASVPAALRDKPVLNSYSFGGPLILHGIRPFIDGRTDLYGGPFVVDFKKLQNGDRRAFDTAQKRWNFQWALISTDDQAMMAMLYRSPDWRPIRADRYSVMFVRGTPKPRVAGQPVRADYVPS
jgi:hypothetical protein